MIINRVRVAKENSSRLIVSSLRALVMELTEEALALGRRSNPF